MGSDKATLNHLKHGIHFNEAKALWDDPGRILLPSRFPDEPRYLAIEKIEQTCWTAIFTERGDVIRIISVRRTRPGDARQARTPEPAGPVAVGLGMPALGVPAPLPPAPACG